MLLVVYQGVTAGGRIVIKKISSINYEFYEPLLGLRVEIANKLISM